MIHDETLDALLHIINLSITTGTFDSLWKEQMIGPHYKKNDPTLMMNCRPVSIIIQLGKLPEMEVSDQVITHYTENKLFHNAHNGSLPNLDTTTALVQVYNHMVKAADSKKLCGTVLLDQTSAYDLVDHQLLLEKLECYNFSPLALNWFQTYLHERTFRYQIESKRSEPHPVGPYGIPQGSVLGGLLYIISQNDLPDAPPDSDTGQTTLFVDDDTEQESDENPERLQTKLQSRVNSITDWLSDNRMVVEPTKTKLIVSMTREMKARRYPDLNLKIKVGNQTISQTPSEKLLGVVISEDMTWRPHIWGESWRESDNWRGIIPQLLQRLGMLRYLGRVTSNDKMRVLIPGIFTSKLTYALPLIGSTWGFAGYRSSEPMKTCFTKHDINTLQSLQRQAALLLLPPSTGLDLRSTESVIQDVKWLSVHQMIANSILNLFLRMTKSGVPIRFLEDLTLSRDTRSAKGQYKNQRYNLNISLENFQNQAVRLYNSLPISIKTLDRGNRQKKELRSWVSASVKFKP